MFLGRSGDIDESDVRETVRMQYPDSERKTGNDTGNAGGAAAVLRSNRHCALA